MELHVVVSAVHSFPVFSKPALQMGTLLLSVVQVTDTAFGTAVQAVHVSGVAALPSPATTPGMLKNPALQPARLSSALLQVTDPSIEFSTGAQAVHVSMPFGTAVRKKPFRQTASLLPASVQVTVTALTTGVHSVATSSAKK
jgi:hypothetical protein